MLTLVGSHGTIIGVWCRVEDLVQHIVVRACLRRHPVDGFTIICGFANTVLLLRLGMKNLMTNRRLPPVRDCIFALRTLVSSILYHEDLLTRGRYISI